MQEHALGITHPLLCLTVSSTLPLPVTHTTRAPPQTATVYTLCAARAASCGPHHHRCMADACTSPTNAPWNPRGSHEPGFCRCLRHQTHILCMACRGRTTPSTSHPTHTPCHTDTLSTHTHTAAAGLAGHTPLHNHAQPRRHSSMRWRA
jgi:hypothetical protein